MYFVFVCCFNDYENQDDEVYLLHNSTQVASKHGSGTISFLSLLYRLDHMFAMMIRIMLPLIRMLPIDISLLWAWWC